MQIEIYMGALLERRRHYLYSGGRVLYNSPVLLRQEEAGLFLPPSVRSFLMRVILLQSVEGLGKAGDLKDVANGYARNYLLPRRLAAGATASLIANREQRIATEKRRLDKLAEQNQQLSERLSQISLTFRTKVGSQGRLYGSITSQDIASALRDAESITIDRRMIDLAEPLRSLGTFTVPVKVSTGLEPKITVNVVNESGQAAS